VLRRADMIQASVCVFCGSSGGADPRYTAAAADVGRAIATRGLRVVYGGASVGTMGAVADAALAAGGAVLGVIPAALDAREIAHSGVTELRVVDSMHVRKQTMADESDAFVALPGGFGTLDELFEIATWRQLGLHDKPVALLNGFGFYDALIQWIDHAVEARFVSRDVRALITVLPSVDALGTWLDAVAPGARGPRRGPDVR